MSLYVRTAFGRFNIVRDGNQRTLLWECPQCRAHGGMSEDQLAGRVSVVCSGPSGNGGCDYHETHQFGPAVIAAMQANVLMHGTPEDPTTERNE